MRFQTIGLTTQERGLCAFDTERILSEKVSSVVTRDRLKECLSFMRGGALLVVTKPDRLARSTTELLTILSGSATWEREIMLER